MSILEEAALRAGAGWEAQGHCPGRAGSVGLQQGEVSELHGAGGGLEAEWVLPGFGRKRGETTHFPPGRERAGWLLGGAAETGGLAGGGGQQSLVWVCRLLGRAWRKQEKQEGGYVVGGHLIAQGESEVRRHPRSSASERWETSCGSGPSAHWASRLGPGSQAFSLRRLCLGEAPGSRASGHWMQKPQHSLLHRGPCSRGSRRPRGALPWAASPGKPLQRSAPPAPLQKVLELPS